MIRRTGVTLIEVLVAIFVTALGLLALLALFPLGAVNMAHAIKDTRTAHAAAEASGNIKVWRILQPNSSSSAAIQNDVAVFSGYAGGPSLPLPSSDGPSYGVLVDPIGFQSYSSVPSFARWVAGTPGIPRQTVSVFTSNLTPAQRQATLLRWFALVDDVTFGPDGLPSGGFVQRENRYTWAYLLRRPRFSDPSIVEMTIAVFDRRPLQLGAGSFLPVGENAYPVEFDPSDPLNTVNLVYANGLPK